MGNCAPKPWHYLRTRLCRNDRKTEIWGCVRSAKSLYSILRRWERSEGIRLASLAVGGLGLLWGFFFKAHSSAANQAADEREKKQN